MQYLLMIYGDETVYDNMSEAETQELMEGHNTFTETVSKDGVLVGGQALHPTSSATTVRVVDGKTITTDGPFAETKEQLGGYYLLDCENLDDAIKYAAQIPNDGGCVEIRPLMVFE